MMVKLCFSNLQATSLYDVSKYFNKNPNICVKIGTKFGFVAGINPGKYLFLGYGVFLDSPSPCLAVYMPF